MISTPSNPDTLLSRKELSATLTAAGFKTAEAALATLASRGGGPPMKKYGKYPVYRLADALAWARGRTR
jgi:hypothetical protein